MTSNYGPYGLLNIDQYRKALRKVKHGKTGVYPKIDKEGNLVYFIMHRNMKSMQILCDQYIDCPRHFIRKNHKKKHGYFYVRLVDPYVTIWRKVVDNFDRYFWENV